MKQLLPQQVLGFFVTSNQDVLSSSALLSKYGHESQDVTALMSSLRPQIKIVHKPMGDVTVGLYFARAKATNRTST